MCLDSWQSESLPPLHFNILNCIDDFWLLLRRQKTGKTLLLCTSKHKLDNLPERNFHVPVIELRSDSSQLTPNLRKDCDSAKHFIGMKEKEKIVRFLL